MNSPGRRVDDGTPTRRRVGVVRLVARREIAERLRTKSFYVLTGLLMVIILGLGVANRVVGSDGPDTIQVGVTGIVGAASDELSAAIVTTADLVDRKVEIRSFDDVTAARVALADGDVDVVVDAADRLAVFDGFVDDEVFAVVAQAWSMVELIANLQDAGLTEQEAIDVLSAESLTSQTLEDERDVGIALLIGSVSAVLLLLSLQMFGGYVLSGVVEEKSSAVVELLLVRVRSDQLLAGKIIGIGVTGLLQFSLAVAAGLASLAISGDSVPAAVWSAWPMTLVWFIGGFALYSTLFALAGSLVSRQEDAQAASAPIMSVMIAAYAVVFMFGFDTESTTSTVLSMVPPIAPLLMPMRMAAGDASVVQVVVALALLVLTTYGAWKLTGRIFHQVLLQRGARISWRRALALAGIRRPTDAGGHR